MMFSLVIANYNSEKWISKCLESIFDQTYKDYELVIVDDVSTDRSLEIIEKYKNEKMQIIKLDHKAYNGGARNIGVKAAKGRYIVFMDCDDWFYSNDCLMTIAREIERTNADLIRLPYQAYTTKARGRVNFHENTPAELVKSIFVAPWTKCVKRELFVEFPENTLLEDVVQHIAQIDVIETIGHVNIPIIVWNRANDNAISSDNAKYDKNSKRYSSVYRNLADLLDLRCKHDYCEEHRLWRIRNYEDIIQRGDILGLINGRNAR